jgi:catechol 2,3-dioxygenase-like lactoylglutathione lyase family enzyme
MLKYHHLGIPTTKKMPGEKYLPEHYVYVSGYEESNYNIEWMRYEPESTLPEIVKTVPHVAFEVDDVLDAIKGKKVIIQPNSPSEGVIVAFIEENGAPIEFIQDKHLHGK